MQQWNYYVRRHESVPHIIEEKYIDPYKIFFSQDSIARVFRNHQSVNETAKKLVGGELKPDDFPNIQVVRRSDGLHYTLDNRRLYAFRIARRYRVILKVKVLVLKEEAFHGKKFTSKNGGTAIFIRDATTYAHWKSAWNEYKLTSCGVRTQIRRTHAVTQPQHLVTEVNKKPNQINATSSAASCYEGEVAANREVVSVARTRRKLSTVRAESHTDIIGKMSDLSINMKENQARPGYVDESCQHVASEARVQTEQAITTLRQAKPTQKYSNDCNITGADKASTESTSRYIEKKRLRQLRIRMYLERN